MQYEIKLKNNNKITINITAQDYEKLNNVIHILKSKYDPLLRELYYQEQQNLQIFDFEKFRKEICTEGQVIENIIKDVLKSYKEELNDLQCVFLSGSYARGTNKLSSDLDLHFLYKSNKNSFIYEEIVCYIISHVMNKSRDCIDPTFTLNLLPDYKEYVTSQMNNFRLSIVLKSIRGVIKYSYSKDKKRRFFLQHNNPKNIKVLKKYIIEQVVKHNLEWTHCFRIIYGDILFNNCYNDICKIEKKYINIDNIVNRIDCLNENLNKLNLEMNIKDIAIIKKNYQSYAFERIYEYISIVRLLFIYQGIDIPFINLFNIYDQAVIFNYEQAVLIQKIYKYMWLLRNLTVYCYQNSVNYGLHNHEYIYYDVTELNKEWLALKEALKDGLLEMRNML